jgi:hypothetical protein
MTEESAPVAATTTTAPAPGQTINIQAPIAQPTNGLAVASMILGIIAIFTFWIPFLGWVPVILGLVLGLIAFSQPYGRGMAIAGVVCSGLALAVKLVFWVFFIGILGAAGAAGAAAGPH